MIGLPPTAGGTLVNGGSMANLIGLTVARNAMAGIDLREESVVALDPHKWLHAPFEVGCTLVRDHAGHRRTFAVSPEYRRAPCAASPRANGCTNTGSRPAAASAR